MRQKNIFRSKMHFLYFSEDINLRMAFFKNVKLRWLKSSLNFFLFLRFFLGQNHFNSQGILLIKMSSQVITNGNIIKRVTYLQIVTQCNICTNVKVVFFAHCAKSINKLPRGLKSISYPVIMCIVQKKMVCCYQNCSDLL